MLRTAIALALVVGVVLGILHSIYFSSPSFSAFSMPEQITVKALPKPPKYKLYSFFPEDDYDDDFDMVDDAYCIAGEEEIAGEIATFNALSAPPPPPASQKQQQQQQKLTSSERAAKQKLASVMEELGQGRGPFIAGGIGDSGTRGVHDLFERLGIYMMHNGEVIAVSKDSKSFMKAYPAITQSGAVRDQQSYDLYMDPIRASSTLNYNITFHVSREKRALGQQWVADMMLDTLGLFARYRETQQLGGGAETNPFGFKHPRTSLLLPFLFDALGDRFTFIHIVRDGRAVARGNNVHMFKDICRAYYTDQSDPTMTTCASHRNIEMWAAMNQDIFDFARSTLRAHQYYAVRIEDLVDGKRHCYDHLVRFLGLRNTTQLDMALNTTMHEEMMPHSTSYFANKNTPSERREMLLLEKQSPEVRRALRFWGYDVRTMRDTKTDCLNLPWLKLMRKAKGYHKV